MKRLILLIVMLFGACAAPAPAPDAPTFVPVVDQPSTATLVGEGGAGGAPADSAEPARVGFVPQPCVTAGWKARACVKSATSSRYYIAVPDGRPFAEKLTAVIMPPPLGNICIPEGTRACGGYPYDVCNDGATDYFYCGNTTKHDAEGYYR